MVEPFYEQVERLSGYGTDFVFVSKTDNNRYDFE